MLTTKLPLFCFCFVAIFFFCFAVSISSKMLYSLPLFLRLEKVQQKYDSEQGQIFRGLVGECLIQLLQNPLEFEQPFVALLVNLLVP